MDIHIGHTVSDQRGDKCVSSLPQQTAVCLLTRGSPLQPEFRASGHPGPLPTWAPCLPSPRPRPTSSEPGSHSLPRAWLRPQGSQACTHSPESPGPAARGLTTRSPSSQDDRELPLQYPLCDGRTSTKNQSPHFMSLDTCPPCDLTEVTDPPPSTPQFPHLQDVVHAPNSNGEHCCCE